MKTRTHASGPVAVPVAGRPRWHQRLPLQEDLNFLLTNRVPRLVLTRLMGWFSRIRSPALTRLSIAVWRGFTDLDLSEAQTQRFDSLQACFTRALKAGARPLDPDRQALLSPCDAIVGACGDVQGTTVFQAKGFPYRIGDLLGDDAEAARHRDGVFVTLRLTSAMYHRFHAPDDARLEHVRFFRGDTWNVNPIALARVERLFCRNERAALRLRLDDGATLTLVPVAAILVASLRLHAPALHLHQRYRGPVDIRCDVPVARGQELGWFEHGSTIVVFAPRGFALAPGVAGGQRIRVGQALLRRPPDATAASADGPSSSAGHAAATASAAFDAAGPPAVRSTARALPAAAAEAEADADRPPPTSGPRP
jgi:phosphatidylserine decarboxylase